MSQIKIQYTGILKMEMNHSLRKLLLNLFSVWSFSERYDYFLLILTAVPRTSNFARVVWVVFGSLCALSENSFHK